MFYGRGGNLKEVLVPGTGIACLQVLAPFRVNPRLEGGEILRMGAEGIACLQVLAPFRVNPRS